MTHLPKTQELQTAHIRQAIANINWDHSNRIYDLVHEAYNRGLQDGYRQGAAAAKATARYAA